jgi:cysteine dioxygenase
VVLTCAASPAPPFNRTPRSRPPPNLSIPRLLFHQASLVFHPNSKATLDLIHHVDFQTSTSHPSSHHPLSSSPFNHLLDSIARSLAHTRSANLPHLTSLLRAYASNPLEWSKYAHANPSKQYTRNLVRQVPGLFNLLLLVWTPGMKSPVHDHADAHCLMKVLKGDLVERRFAFPRFPGMGGRLTETGNARYAEGKVTYMADRLGLHSIANPSPSEYAVSLHRKFKVRRVCSCRCTNCGPSIYPA